MAKKENAVKKEPKEKKAKEDKPKELGLFDILRSMFTYGSARLNEFPKVLIDRNYFMINRILAIQFPMQAQVFQQGKINNVEIVYCWADFLKMKGYTKVPGFVYTKGVQRSKESVEAKKKIPESLIREYARHYNVSMKDIHAALSLTANAEEELMKFKKRIESDCVTKENNKAL